MKNKPSGHDDMGTGILRTMFGYGCIVAGVAIFIILAIAATCKL